MHNLSRVYFVFDTLIFIWRICSLEFQIGLALNGVYNGYSIFGNRKFSCVHNTQRTAKPQYVEVLYYSVLLLKSP